MSRQRIRGGHRRTGISRQEVIKSFFGVQAGLAVVLWVLVALVLAREAFLFFPAYHRQLQIYRKSGLEYAALMEEALEPYRKDVAALAQACEAEAASLLGDLRQRLAAFDAAREFAREMAGSKLTLLEAALERREAEGEGEAAARLDPLIVRLKSELSEQRPLLREALFQPRFLGVALPWKRPRVAEMRGLAAGEQDKLAEEALRLELWEREGGAFRQQIVEGLKAAAAAAAGKLEPVRMAAEVFGPVGLAEPLETVWREAVDHATRCRQRAQTHAEIARRIAADIDVFLRSQDPAARQERLGAALELVAGAEFFDEYARIFYAHRLTEVLKTMVPGEAAYRSLAPAVRQRVEAVLSPEGERARFVEFLNSVKKTVDAFPQAVPEGCMESEMRFLLNDLTRLEPGTGATMKRLGEAAVSFVKDFPFEEEAGTLSGLTARFEEGVARMRKEGQGIFLREWPVSGALQSPAARQRFALFRKRFEADVKSLEAAVERLRDWRPGRRWSGAETAGAFFFGKKWDPRDGLVARYSVAPLFLGSLTVSLIALGVAVPVSVAGALYLHELAPARERRFLRPAIELIGAIPTVVLGALGAAAVGEMTRRFGPWNFGGWELEDALGGRLPLAAAGLLLGLLAIPVILARCEEALGKAPAMWRDSALALGATPLRTAFGVVAPSVGGGLCAAVLFGFGRVLGETMIVLMVLGNRHFFSLPGMIAESAGRAQRGSAEYHALFLAGLALLALTLSVNYLGQKLSSRRHPLEE